MSLRGDMSVVRSKQANAGERRPKSAGAARVPPPVRCLPSGMPVGRLMSPLGRSIVASSGGGGYLYGGIGKEAPVILISPLTSGTPGKVGTQKAD